jgi:hypothetical protein
MWESVGLRYVQEIDCQNTGCPGHYEVLSYNFSLLLY